LIYGARTLLLRRTGHSGEAPQPSVLRHATRPVACKEQRTTLCAACDVQHTTLPRGMRRATCGPAQRTAQDVCSGGFSGDVLRRVHERAALLLLDLLSAPASLSREYPEYPCSLTKYTPSPRLLETAPAPPRPRPTRRARMPLSRSRHASISSETPSTHQEQVLGTTCARRPATQRDGRFA
jgi:hypothetical protein